jgi:hypothetical protein
MNGIFGLGEEKEGKKKEGRRWDGSPALRLLAGLI